MVEFGRISPVDSCIFCSILFMDAKLQSTKPSRALSKRLRDLGVPTVNNYIQPIYTVDSPEFKAILECIETDSIGDGAVIVHFEYNACDDIPLVDLLPLDSPDPFMEITNEIIDGIVWSSKGLFPYDNLDSTSYQLAPARDAMRRILRALQNPPMDRCPVSHSIPGGSYMNTVIFEFGNWVFGVRLYRL